MCGASGFCWGEDAGDAAEPLLTPGSQVVRFLAILYPRHPDAVCPSFFSSAGLIRFRGWSMRSFRMFLRVFHSGESSGRVLGSGPSHL